MGKMTQLIQTLQKILIGIFYQYLILMDMLTPKAMIECGEKPDRQIMVCVQELMLTEIGDTTGTMEDHLTMDVLILIMDQKRFLKLKIGMFETLSTKTKIKLSFSTLFILILNWYCSLGVSLPATLLVMTS